MSRLSPLIHRRLRSQIRIAVERKRRSVPMALPPVWCKSDKQVSGLLRTADGSRGISWFWSSRLTLAQHCYIEISGSVRIASEPRVRHSHSGQRMGAHGGSQRLDAADSGYAKEVDLSRGREDDLSRPTPEIPSDLAFRQTRRPSGVGGVERCEQLVHRDGSARVPALRATWRPRPAAQPLTGTARPRVPHRIIRPEPGPVASHRAG